MLDKDTAIKAIQLAADVVKQLITVSSGVIAFTVTFLKDLKPNEGERKLLVWSWLALLLSIIFGVLALEAQVGNLGVLAKTPEPAKAFYWNDRLPALVQHFSFLIGIGLLMRYGQKWLRRAVPSQDPPAGTSPPAPGTSPETLATGEPLPVEQAELAEVPKEGAA